MRLADATAAALPTEIARPRYRRAEHRSGIVHLGVGAFHRAHQAVYTDDALAAGDRDWLITGVSLRSPQVRDTLNPQDGLYTVTERGRESTASRLIGSLRQVLVAPEDPGAVVAAIGDPATHIVTLTVTEKGYHRSPATGLLDHGDPAIRAELAGGAPTTTPGLLAAGLAARRAKGAGPLTIVSCDNLSHNGRVLSALMNEFLEARDPSLRRWADDMLSFPSTMVDRIVPAATVEQLGGIAASLGMRDEAAVTTEPFHQWVVEDAFAGPRPRWEVGGAQLVRDVGPFETAKLRMLNGSHSTLAYMGLALGLDYVDQAVNHPTLGRLAKRQMDAEAGPSIPATPGLDVAAYGAALIERFRNVDLKHRLDQIAMDGSQKIPQRWLATIADRWSDGAATPAHILSVAAWMDYVRGHRVDGTCYPVSDPHAAAFAAMWEQAAGDVDRVVALFARDAGIFPPEFIARTGLLAAISVALRTWLERGAPAAIADLVEQTDRVERPHRDAG